jgi:hypothetical protein
MKPDNNIDRVATKARNAEALLYWQAINTHTNHRTFVDEIDLPMFERENNVGMTWLLTPVLDLSIVDVNGNHRS